MSANNFLRGASKKIFVPLVFLLIGGVSGFFLHWFLAERQRGDVDMVVHREGSYRFIDPLLECNDAAAVLRGQELKPFRDTVDDFIRNKLDRKWAQSVSLYFRELNDGIGFGIGEYDRFDPASLRKVPLMIALFKEAEVRGDLLSRRVKCELMTDHNAPQNIKPSRSVEPGKEYSVDELIYRMIVYSDNNAFYLLAGIVDPSELQKVYQLLSLPSGGHPDDHLSVHTYASFFRILYNASYLNRQMSEKALDYLSNVEFRTGLVAGVPSDIAVAHKFGEHSDETTGERQLHDCGIVYYPKHPYLLCIMSRGTSFEYLDDAIAELSRLVSAQVDEQHRLHGK